MENISKSFCLYMFEEFPSAFESPFSRGLLENIVVESEKIDSIAERCEWLCNVIPEVTLDEVRNFLLR